jgi:hypothetical protein
MRTESAACAKRAGKVNQRVPRPGTRLRELYDLFHVYRGEPRPFILTRCDRILMEQLSLFYGLDIRNLGPTKNQIPGSGRGPSIWVLAGEWFGRHYVDYIAERIEKLEKNNNT